MATAVRDSDLRVMLDVVEAVSAAPPDVPGLPAEAYEQLATLVPSDLMSFCDFDYRLERAYLDQDSTGDTWGYVVDPTDSDEFFTHYWDTKPCSYPNRTGDRRTVTTVSDFYTQREWHQTPMFVDCFLGSGHPFDHSISTCMPGSSSRLQRLLFFRLSSRDFDERERLLLSLLRPHLAEVMAERKTARESAVELTPRQVELMRLVADGRTNAQIAAELVVSTHTVRRHLENIFERLHVTSRAAAVMRAFPNGVSVGGT